MTPRHAGALAALLALTAAPALAHEGWGIVSTPARGIFFTDVFRRVVWTIGADGALVAARERTHSHALVTIGDGAVYGADVDEQAPAGGAWRIDAAGELQQLLPLTRDIALGFESFLIDSDGTIYSGIGWAPEGRAVLLRRRPDGIIERVATGFSSIAGMAWAPDGAILLTDGPHLKRVTLDGAVETLGGGPLTAARWGPALRGVTTDGSGGAFVADFAGGRLLNVGRHAGVAVEYGSNFPWSPTGVARDADGLIVLEHLQRPWTALARLQVGPYLRVRRLGLKGRVQTLAVLWGTRTWIAGLALAGVTAAVIGWRLRVQHRGHAGGDAAG